jgi:exportin-7
MPMSLHRKIASSFKDQFLLQIFQISLASLNQMKSEGLLKMLCGHLISIRPLECLTCFLSYGIAAPDDFIHVPLDLALKCLSFDFIGSPVDESSEEFGTVQVCLPHDY